MSETKGKGFIEVFNNIYLDESVKGIIEQVIVERIVLQKEKKVVQVYITSGEILYDQIVDLLEEKIRSNVLTDFEVELKVRYSIDHSLKRLMHLYWDNILYTVRQESPICSGIMLESEWEVNDKTLNITVPNQNKPFLIGKNIHKILEKKIEEELGYKLKVDFVEQKLSHEQKEEYHEQREAFENQLVNETVTKFQIEANNQQDQQGNQKDKKDSEQPDYIILGKGIQGSTIPINAIDEESGEVIIVGDVLAAESREIKGDRFIISFDITDYTNSITVKSFVKKKDFENRVATGVKKGATLKVKGNVQYDKFSQEIVVMTRNIEKSNIKFNYRMDNSEEKRVELHAHTQMSEMDATVPASELVAKAAEWGHKAVAITDHGVCQGFPEAANAAKKHGIKVLYGIEAYIVDDLKKVVENGKGESLDDCFVVFDIETTGFNKNDDSIIEIGAVKVEGGEITGEYSTFVDPKRSIPTKITELTGIKDEDVSGAPLIKEALIEFLDFVGDAILVAHNASFDVGFIKNKAGKIDVDINHTVLDTLELARALFPQLSRHRLNNIAKHLGVSLENHHRAVDDAMATAEIFVKCIDLLREVDIYLLEDINFYAADKVDKKKLRANHAVILVQNYTGLKNLYELTSMAHIQYFYRTPRIPKSLYMKKSEGLIIGTACEAGELYNAVLNNDPPERLEELCRFYDYLEIQPIGNNNFMLKKGLVKSEEDLRENNRKIVALGEKYNKPVVATCDVHFMEPKDEVFRRILMAAKKFSDADNQPPLYFRTTEEMLEEFAYLGEEKAREVVIHNTNRIADMIETIKPIPDETFPPHIEGSDEELTKITMDKAISMYGDPLPEPVKERLDRELGSIIKNGFAVLYIIAQKLVWKSMADGYLVGSRGSVGSSFVATMSGITEVNPLAPHYYCGKCQYSDFDSEVVKSFGGGSGYDMPDKECPECGTILIKDGHDIPFETFLGFDGDKEPDIDLNFSGDYQPRAHAYTEELFGKKQVFKAGTIGTVAEKTAYGFVKKYLDERNIIVSNAEINRLLQGCTGVKRTSGQHPGGQMVVPQGHSIEEFCPVQRPANDVKSHITTTHFDYHSISGRLLKLDILGHDDPTVIRMLQDLTGIDPQDIPLDDKKVMTLFTSTEALGVEPDEIGSQVGSYGLPEFGTKFVRQMLVDTQPHTFSELIRISGLSHGTDVWLNNAQELVRAGTATLSECISTRDDIMVYLIYAGVEKINSFKIMEKVRKGKGLTPEDEAEMKENGVPNWYIDSCKKIKYMFPKAHAAAYVMMAYRIAFFKVHHPECFYATFFTVRADDFDYELMCSGKGRVQATIKEIEEKGNGMSTKEKGVLTILEIVLEMLCRNINFIPIDLYTSDAVKFQVTEEGILPPLNAIQGLGNTAAYNVIEARKDGEFLSVEEFRQRTKVSKTVIEVMKENKILTNIPETNQLSLF